MDFRHYLPPDVVRPLRNLLPKVLSLNLIKPLDLTSVYREYNDNKESYKEVTQEVGQSVIQLASLFNRSLPWKNMMGVGIPLKVKRDSRDMMTKCNK